MNDKPPLATEPVGFDVAIGDLTQPVALEADDLVAAVQFVRDNTGLSAHIGSDGLEPVKVVRRLPPDLELGEFAVRTLNTRVTRAVLLPPGRLHTVARGGPIAVRAGLVVLAVLALVVAASGQLPPGSGLPVTVLCAVAVAQFFYWPTWLRIFTATFEAGQHRYGMDALLPDGNVADDGAQTRAVAQVNEVKEEYGRLLSDIVFRIEAPALFDPVNPASRSFTKAMIAWDARADDLSAAELGTLAAAVVSTFSTARREAETLGMSYLPEAARPTAGRAAAAARLATGGATPAERKAALSRMIELLSSLAIYYLPNPQEATRMIEGKPVLALPGRRQEPEATTQP